MYSRQAPAITDTPPTPIESPENNFTRRFRSHSRQLLGSLHEVRSRSSSGSRRHSRSPDCIKDVIANLGLAAGTVGAKHIKPGSPRERDVLEGVWVFLSGFQNIIQRSGTDLQGSIQTIEVGDDADSIHGCHPITDAESNPFGEDTDAEHEAQINQQSTSEVDGRRRFSLPHLLFREESFGEFVMDIWMYEKESGDKLPGRARLDTGMTFNAISHSHALELGHPIEEYTGEPCIVADGTHYQPIGQVTLPFHFVNFRTAKTWRVEFIVFTDQCPFDVAFGRRFISLANLLKRNPEALPVVLAKKKPYEIKEMREATSQRDRDSIFAREQHDRKYEERRKAKLKEQDSKKR